MTNSLLVTSYICIILSIGLCKCCTFDQIQINSIHLPQVYVPYSQPATRHTRSAPSTFSPIRIHVHYNKLSEISTVEIQRLQNVVKDAVSKISSLLSVIPVEGTLLLQRNEACKRTHISGPNSGKCSQLKPNYSGEFCLNKVDRFKIPDEHLLGLNVYSISNSLPLATSLPDGTGVRNTDFILYVNSRFSSWCQEQDLIAYASYCQLDQNDRPIAGFVNFCPVHLSTKLFSKLKATMTAAHEVFHALGFSHDLFSKYKDCQYSTSTRRHCYIQREPYQREEEGGEARIILPSVIREANLHFGCDQELGVPLEKSAYGLSSHWDPLIMHNSIMAPSFQQPEEVSIDPITISLFADMGWYQVNYSAVDVYPWAKDAGCDFLQSFQCSKYSFLCNRSLINEFGCAMSSKGIAECISVSDKQFCGIFKQNEKLCCQNKHRKIYSLLSTSLDQASLNKEHLHSDNVTLMIIPLTWPRPRDILRLPFNTSQLHLMALQKLLGHFCHIDHWLINSSLKIHQSNDSYLLYIWYKNDQNMTDEKLTDQLEYLAHFGNLSIDSVRLESKQVAALAPQRGGEAVSFLRGWEALVVLGGIATACLFLALLIATFIQLKGRIRHQLRSRAILQKVI